MANNNARKTAARAFQDQHGVSYMTALNAVEREHTIRSRALVNSVTVRVVPWPEDAFYEKLRTHTLDETIAAGADPGHALAVIAAYATTIVALKNLNTRVPVRSLMNVHLVSTGHDVVIPLEGVADGGTTLSLRIIQPGNELRLTVTALHTPQETLWSGSGLRFAPSDLPSEVADAVNALVDYANDTFQDALKHESLRAEAVRRLTAA